MLTLIFLLAFSIRVSYLLFTLGLRIVNHVFLNYMVHYYVVLYECARSEIEQVELYANRQVNKNYQHKNKQNRGQYVGRKWR